MDFGGLPGGGNESTDNAGMDVLAASFSTTTDALVAVYAFTIFVMNAIILIILSRMLLVLRNRRETQGLDIIVNLFFVCLNDTLCGLTLLFLTAIQLEETFTGHICAYTVIFCLALLTTSQGNILCICFQRFMAARNIRKIPKENQLLRNVSLLVANILVGTTSFIITSLQAKIYSRVTATHSVCDFITILGPSAKTVNLTFYYFQLVTTILADILCLTTIVKLKRELSSVASSDATSSQGDTSSSQQSTNARLSVKMKQQKAIITMFLLLVFFNISLLPNLVFSALLTIGIRNTIVPPRAIFLSLFMNSVANPIIIMTRMQNIRQEIKKFFAGLKRKLSSCSCLKN